MSIFFSPIEKIQSDSVQMNPETNNYTISTSAVKRTKKATEAVAKALFSPATPTTRPAFLMKTSFVSPITMVSPISLMCTPAKQDDPFITPIHQLRSPKDPDTPRPIRQKSVSVYFTPLKL